MFRQKLKKLTRNEAHKMIDQNWGFCGFGARSYTNPVSNLVFLDQVNLRDDLLRIVEGRFVALRLPLAVHEFTHHACLSSPVGSSLSLLNFLSQRAAWVMNERKDPLSVDSFADLYIRYYAATIVLRPLFEGIALFAEFDSYPGGTETISWPMIMASIIGTSFYPKSFETEILRMKLQMARAEMLDKRTDLFCSPLSSKNGGYLLGAMLVRHLWKLAASKDEFFLDPDAFLTYVMEIAFGDYRMVNLLLAEPRTGGDLRPFQVAEDIASRLIFRLESYFASPDLVSKREKAEAYKHQFAFDSADAQVKHKSGESPLGFSTGVIKDHSALLFNDEEDVRTASALINATTRTIELDLPCGDEACRKLFPQSHVKIFNRREYFWFGTVPVTWERQGDSVSVTADGQKMTFDKVSGFHPNSVNGEGSIEVVLILGKATLAVILVAGGEKLLLHAPDGLTKDRRESLLLRVDARDDLEHSDTESNVFLSKSVAQILPAEDWAHIISDCHNAADASFCPLIAESFSLSNREQFLNEVKSQGILGAVGNDVDAVRLLAAASFLGVFRPPVDHFLNGMARLDYSFEDVNRVNAAYREKFGTDLVVISDGGVWTRC